ncbi:MAG: phosphoribosylformylglycinamidine synthase, partial [Clostridia bacterium]|nr:phosphoribosylformylglycinamidine synthase [Clostridia bacterium]
AATCIGGAIRDPLSGRSYVYAAMRVTGASDPTVPISETMEGKLPQRKLTTTAAAGYSSYGNQIGLATGQVDELYHPGYAAKRMEIGAVIAAAPQENVRRERPVPGDVIILLGGKTGRDGCGGATGSSKAHNVSSIETCGAEVQKGNAPEERKLQRLFRDPEASKLIKRCNDFGAGGVSVAIGELADGIKIDLNAVPRKYDGLDGTELAISESQERMAVVVAPGDADRFLKLSDRENLEATVVAVVTEEKRLVMSWNGVDIVDISREFLDSNGAPKHITVHCKDADGFEYKRFENKSFRELLISTASDLNVCSKRGLSERFDSTIGAGTVLMPFGGKYQRTPSQAMVNKISVEHGDTDTVSAMSWCYDPYLSEQSPYHGAYIAVMGSIAKLIASGAEYKDIYLTFQEYFEKPMRDPERWGKPAAAILGALSAQLDLGAAAIGGKDSMSGTFEKLDVPPTLVSFAVTTSSIARIISPEFKAPGNKVYFISPETGKYGYPDASSFVETSKRVAGLVGEGKIISAWTPCFGGISEAVIKMSMGNAVGFSFDGSFDAEKLNSLAYGTYVVEANCDLCGKGVSILGSTTDKKAIALGSETVSLDEICEAYEGRLESVFTCNNVPSVENVKEFNFRSETKRSAAILCAKPRVLIPVFPGTNCEYDSVKAVERAGASAETVVINNKTPAGIADSVEYFASRIDRSQAIFIPGGFSGGDEPDGSGKFITAFFRGEAVKEAAMRLLECRDGLMLGICNGFQALIKLGLVPYGKITDADADSPTLTFNTIGRHQSKIVSTRVASNKSPWLSRTEPGEVYCVPISHGEGNFVASEETVRALAENGQIATQYADLEGKVCGSIQFNPNGSVYSIEGITSPDGRVLGKMGHSERIGEGLYKNVPGNYNMHLFEAMTDYYKI